MTRQDILEATPGPGETYCPERDCFNGRIIKVCPLCEASLDDCTLCEGAGEVDAGACQVCGGRAIVSRALAKLYEAERWVRVNDRDWSGDDADHPGITLYSLAKWYRQRGFLRDAVARAVCQPDDCVAGAVVLEDRLGRELSRLHGFAWGYGGEGPNGLAAVLADVFFDRFRDPQDAMREVTRHPMSEGWEIARAVHA